VFCQSINKQHIVSGSIVIMLETNRQAVEIVKAKKYFYIATGLWATFFATANWLFFWRLYLTNGGIGLLDAICFAVGMLAQVPTGAIADKIGRRQIMILAAILMGVGYATTGFAVNGAWILIGYLVYSVGSSFFSGADDALMYDYLKTKSCEKDWETVARHKQMIRRICNLSAVFIGGYLYIWSVRLPSIVRGLTFLLMVIPLISMKFMDKDQPQKSSNNSVASYGRHIWHGMKELLNRKMLPVILLILFVQGTTAVIFIGGILRPLMLERSGLAIVNQSNFLALIQIPVVLLLFYRSKHHKSAFNRAIFWAGCTVVGFLLNIPLHYKVLALAGVALIHFGSYLIIPATSRLINEAVSSKYRATTLSTASLLEQIPYIFAAPLIGLAADRHQITLVIEIVAVCMITAVLVAATIYRLNKPKLNIR
jgi:MFS family permease